MLLSIVVLVLEVQLERRSFKFGKVKVVGSRGWNGGKQANLFWQIVCGGGLVFEWGWRKR